MSEDIGDLSGGIYAFGIWGDTPGYEQLMWNNDVYLCLSTNISFAYISVRTITSNMLWNVCIQSITMRWRHHENALPIIGPLYPPLTGGLPSLSQMANKAKLGCFLYYWPEQAFEQTVELTVS